MKDKFLIINEPKKQKIADIAVNIAFMGLFPSVATVANLVKAGVEPLTVEEAEKIFSNATNTEWKVNHIYYKHPRKDNILILHKDYKDYLLREMVADIANYVQDHIAVTKLIIGVISSKKGIIGGTVNTQELNANAKINCQLDKQYIVNYSKSAPSKIKSNRNYIWMDKFPDIKSAIEHHNLEFESSKEMNIDFNLDLNLSEKLGLIGCAFQFSNKKKEALYIYYNAEK